MNVSTSAFLLFTEKETRQRFAQSSPAHPTGYVKTLGARSHADNRRKPPNGKYLLDGLATLRHGAFRPKLRKVTNWSNASRNWKSRRFFYVNHLFLITSVKTGIVTNCTFTCTHLNVTSGKERGFYCDRGTVGAVLAVQAVVTVTIVNLPHYSAVEHIGTSLSCSKRKYTPRFSTPSPLHVVWTEIVEQMAHVKRERHTNRQPA